MRFFWTYFGTKTLHTVEVKGKGWCQCAAKVLKHANSALISTKFEGRCHERTFDQFQSEQS